MIYDVCVIGGGPAGLFGAYYSSSRELSTLLLEAEPTLGGRINYFLDNPLYDLPGQFGITGQSYLQGLTEQLEKSTVTTQLNQHVQSIHQVDALFHIKTQNQEFQARAIVAATGHGIVKPKILKAENVDAAALAQLHYTFPKDMWQHAPQPIAIIGQTPMAAEWALIFASKGFSPTMFTTKPLQLQPMLMDGLQEHRIPIVALDSVQQVRYADGRYSFDQFECSHAICAIGTVKKRIATPFRILQQQNGHTTIDGYFIAGDARLEDGKMKLIHGATHDAMQAVNAAHQYLRPGSTYQPIVSTHHPIFKEWAR